MSRSARAVASASAVLLTSLVLAAPASAVEPAGERSAVCFPGQDPPVANGGRTVRAGDEANLTAAQVDQAERSFVGHSPSGLRCCASRHGPVS